MASTDAALLDIVLDKLITSNPGMAVSIVSERFGPLCGFVPGKRAGSRRFWLDDAKFFGPYRRVF